ncbi:MAG: hypothetical protein VB072_13890 [Lentimicrobium sp.]|nr:hypothetical protein [Lentimicrobium sp.]MEA5111519.1 hypothetical protein [Lentimicrobium sp.]
MKKFLFTITTLWLTQVLAAQTNATDYLKRAPGIPVNVCNVTGSVQDAFLNDVRNLSSVIHEDAANRSREAEEYMKSNEDRMKANMMKKSGMSDEDIMKLQSGKEMTDAEAQAMADKILQQQTNISLDEAKNLSKMSDAGKEAWAQGYAAEQMAVAQANPGQNKGDSETNMSMYELLSEQSTLRYKVTGMENQLRQRFIALDKDAETAKALLEADLKPFYTELNSINDGEGSTRADVEHAERVIKKIQEKQDAYCLKFTPRMLEFIEQCKESYTKALPDYDRLEEIQFQVTSLQTGTSLITTGKGMYSIQAVEQYLDYLDEAFRYKLYRID